MASPLVSFTLQERRYYYKWACNDEGLSLLTHCFQTTETGSQPSQATSGPLSREERQQYVADNPGAFPQFAALPPEIRITIWEILAKPFRVHNIRSRIFKYWPDADFYAPMQPFFKYRVDAFEQRPDPTTTAVALSWRMGRLPLGDRIEGGFFSSEPAVSARHRRELDREALLPFNSRRTTNPDYHDDIECRRGIIHVNREAREAVLRLRPYHETRSINLDDVATPLISDLGNRLIGTSLPRPVIHYHPFRDVFVYEYSEVHTFPFFNHSISGIQHQAERVVIVYRHDWR